MLLLTQSSSTTGDLHGASRGHLYGETFLFVMTWGRGGTDCYCQVVVEARGAAMHPTAPRIALHKEELSCPKCQSCWSQEILFYHILNINSARRGTSIFRIWTHTLYTHIDQRNEKKKKNSYIVPFVFMAATHPSIFPNCSCLHTPWGLPYSSLYTKGLEISKKRK